ncbi:MAG TPA: hypothetical protein VFA26_21175, partial [Gemmataceae bacterium]|nr:hypothetical protein [Gemmataceae bacterium]
MASGGVDPRRAERQVTAENAALAQARLRQLLLCDDPVISERAARLALTINARSLDRSSREKLAREARRAGQDVDDEAVRFVRAYQSLTPEEREALLQVQVEHCREEKARPSPAAPGPEAGDAAPDDAPAGWRRAARPHAANAVGGGGFYSGWCYRWRPRGKRRRRRAVRRFPLPRGTASVTFRGYKGGARAVCPRGFALSSLHPRGGSPNMKRLGWLLAGGLVLAILLSLDGPAVGQRMPPCCPGFHVQAWQTVQWQQQVHWQQVTYQRQIAIQQQQLMLLNPRQVALQQRPVVLNPRPTVFNQQQIIHNQRALVFQPRPTVVARPPVVVHGAPTLIHSAPRTVVTRHPVWITGPGPGPGGRPIYLSHRSTVQAKPVVVQGHPVVVSAKPATVHAQPVTVHAKATTVNNQRTVVTAKPVTVHAQRVVVTSKPVEVHAQQTRYLTETVTVWKKIVTEKPVVRTHMKVDANCSGCHLQKNPVLKPGQLHPHPRDKFPELVAKLQPPPHRPPGKPPVFMPPAVPPITTVLKPPARQPPPPAYVPPIIAKAPGLLPPLPGKLPLGPSFVPPVPALPPPLVGGGPLPTTSPPPDSVPPWLTGSLAGREPTAPTKPAAGRKEKEPPAITALVTTPPPPPPMAGPGSDLPLTAAATPKPARGEDGQLMTGASPALEDVGQAPEAELPATPENVVEPPPLPPWPGTVVQTIAPDPDEAPVVAPSTRPVVVPAMVLVP